MSTWKRRELVRIAMNKALRKAHFKRTMILQRSIVKRDVRDIEPERAEHGNIRLRLVE
jgi:hypothetical protein